MFRKHAHVVHAAIGLERVVVKVRHVVVVEIDRHRPPVPVLLRRILRSVGRGRTVRVAVGLDVDAVVKIRDVVVGDDVPRAVDLHRNVGRHLRWETSARSRRRKLRPEVRPVPADDVIRIVSADEPVVGDVEIARAGIVRVDAHADVLEAAVLHRQPL